MDNSISRISKNRNNATTPHLASILSVGHLVNKVLICFTAAISSTFKQMLTAFPSFFFKEAISILKIAVILNSQNLQFTQP